MTEQTGRLLLMNGHGSGMIRWARKSSPALVSSGKVTDTSLMRKQCEDRCHERKLAPGNLFSEASPGAGPFRLRVLIGITVHHCAAACLVAKGAIFGCPEGAGGCHLTSAKMTDQASGLPTRVSGSPRNFRIGFFLMRNKRPCVCGQGGSIHLPVKQNGQRVFPCAQLKGALSKLRTG